MVVKIESKAIPNVFYKIFRRLTADFCTDKKSNKMKYSIIMNLMILLISGFFSGNTFSQASPEIDSISRREILQSICNTISRYYVYPEKAKEMTYFIEQQQEAGRYATFINPGEFTAEIVKDIRSVSNDKHIRIEYNPRLEEEIIKYTSSKKGAGKINEAIKNNDRKNNFYFKRIEILPSNIGYMEFTNFAGPNEDALKTVQAAMQFVAHSDALIIDLRNNRGGNGSMANEILSYFFKTKTYTGRSFNRIENKWSDNYVENKKKITHGLILNMPLYLLTSGRTFSAAEGFAYTLQNLKNATVIGETTRGGAHLTRSFSIGNGFVAFVPFTRSENVKTKTDWEGAGVIPNIIVDEKEALAVAQNKILNNKLIGETDEIERRKIKWRINFYRSKSSNTTMDVSLAGQFAGRFAEFEVILKEDQLIFRDTNQPHYIPQKLCIITPTLFQAGNDYQVEFIADDNSLFNSIKIYWEDGWIEHIKRAE